MNVVFGEKETRGFECESYPTVQYRVSSMRHPIVPD